MDDLITREKTPVSLDTPMPELEEKLMAENDIDELNNIINIFNLNIKKKDMVRTSKLNDLQDKITTQMQERLTKSAGEFSNKDLLEYFKVLQDTINKSDNSLKDIDTPAIQINQQQVNIGAEGTTLNRESREKIKEFISNMLSNTDTNIFTNKTIVDTEFTEEAQDKDL